MDKRYLAATAAAILVSALVVAHPGRAHSAEPSNQNTTQMPMMQRGMMGQGQGMMGQGMTGQRMMQGGAMPGQMMRDGDDDWRGHDAMHAMMHAHMMGDGQGMMGQGMMGSAMMGGGMMRVRPAVDTGDVSRYFQRYLAQLGNDRLKLGKVAAADDDTITAEIVTVDNSLVQTFTVDRVTGMVSTGK